MLIISKCQGLQLGFLIFLTCIGRTIVKYSIGQLIINNYVFNDVVFANLDLNGIITSRGLNFCFANIHASQMMSYWFLFVIGVQQEVKFRARVCYPFYLFNYLFCNFSFVLKNLLDSQEITEPLLTRHIFLVL